MARFSMHTIIRSNVLILSFIQLRVVADNVTVFFYRILDTVWWQFDCFTGETLNKSPARFQKQTEDFPYLLKP